MFSRWPLFPNEVDHHLSFCDPNDFVLEIHSWQKNATEGLANTPDLSGKKKPVITIKYGERAVRFSSCMPTDARGSCPVRTEGRTRSGCRPCCGRPRSLEVQTSHRKGWWFMAENFDLINTSEAYNSKSEKHVDATDTCGTWAGRTKGANVTIVFFMRMLELLMKREPEKFLFLETPKPYIVFLHVEQEILPLKAINRHQNKELLCHWISVNFKKKGGHWEEPPL